MPMTKEQLSLCAWRELEFTPAQEALIATCDVADQKTIRRSHIAQISNRIRIDPVFAEAYMKGVAEDSAKAKADRQAASPQRRAARREARLADPSVEYERRCKDIRRKYNLAPWAIDKMLTAQHDECPGCGRGISLNGAARTVPAVVNINQKTQRPRGLFCLKCNNAIGLAGESPTTLRNLATVMGDNFETRNPQPQENP